MIRPMLCLVVGVVLSPIDEAAGQSLDPVTVELTAIDDSASYLVYSYTISNPATSSWSIGAFGLDIGASSGTPATLPATGEFLDMTAGSNAVVPLEPYAQVGPIAPGSWFTALRRTAELWWYPPESGPMALDSVAPGATMAGFGIRSTYLPAIRQLRANPTWQSCCIEPDPATNENPSASEFTVFSYVIAPAYAPEEVTVDVLQTQLGTICTGPVWISSGALCTEFDILADSAAAELASGDLEGAAMVLSGLFDRVETEQEEMHTNAYWLLYHNIKQAYANVAAAGPDTLSVICTPSSVERAAAPVTCVPSAPIPPIGADFFSLTAWRFIGGTSGEFQVMPTGTPPDVWEGLMVVGGSVQVYGGLAGVADSASTTVTVTPRSWSPLPVDSVVERDQQFLNPPDMPTVPTSQADLTHFHHTFPTNATFEQWMARRVIVEGGPNDSLAYFSEPFVQTYAPVFEINREALTDNENPWYLNHPNGGPGPTCRRSYLSTTVLTYFVDRMVDEGMAVTSHWPQSNFHATQESLVSTDVGALLTAWVAAITDEVAVLNGVREALGPVVPPCTLLY